MTKHFERRAFLGLLAAGVALPGQAFSQVPQASLRPKSRPGSAKPLAVTADTLVEKSGLSGEIAFSVFNLNSGRPLEARDPTTPMPPASVAKTLTSLYALDVLGPEHRFETRVLATGPVKDGVLDGDLILAGGGDPTLQTDDMADLARMVKDSGLREVKGKFLVWGGALHFQPVIDELQPAYVGYNPAISGLALNFNRVHFQWKREGGGWGVTMDARSEKFRPEVGMARMRVIDRDTPLFTYADADGRDNWTVAQTALGKGGSRWLPVRKPELYAGEVFQTMLRAHGIVLKAPQVVPALPATTPIATRTSEPLSEVLRDMLKYSTNLTAEMVGLAATAKRTGFADSLRSSGTRMSEWGTATLDLKATHMVDHSGLGDDSRTTAGDLIRALTSPLARQTLRPLLKHIPVRDDSYRVDKTDPLQIVAKTGTLNFVSTLAGYASLPDGTDMAFAIMTGDLPRRDALTMSQRESPPGGSAWARRSRILQQKLLQRWSLIHAG